MTERHVNSLRSCLVLLPALLSPMAESGERANDAVATEKEAFPKYWRSKAGNLFAASVIASGLRFDLVLPEDEKQFGESLTVRFELRGNSALVRWQIEQYCVSPSIGRLCPAEVDLQLESFSLERIAATGNIPVQLDCRNCEVIQKRHTVFEIQPTDENARRDVP